MTGCVGRRVVRLGRALDAVLYPPPRPASTRNCNSNRTACCGAGLNAPALYTPTHVSFAGGESACLPACVRQAVHTFRSFSCFAFASRSPVPTIFLRVPLGIGEGLLVRCAQRSIAGPPWPQPPSITCHVLYIIAQSWGCSFSRSRGAYHCE